LKQCPEPQRRCAQFFHRFAKFFDRDAGFILHFLHFNDPLTKGPHARMDHALGGQFLIEPIDHLQRGNALGLFLRYQLMRWLNFCRLRGSTGL